MSGPAGSVPQARHTGLLQPLCSIDCCFNACRCMDVGAGRENGNPATAVLPLLLLPQQQLLPLGHTYSCCSSQ
jgi:hypothetical protein